MKLCKIVCITERDFLAIFSTFGWSFLEIFDQAFFGFGKIGVPYFQYINDLSNVCKYYP